ncbi:hypothetical protein L596_001714 [Steinernema carpocapsae]|uniref:Uncharacterized protein n=1 Tax=Steinernema carpocapsae TaxID=34508 RepID=A0A4U8UN21_STECR|nr:hypothetical protein L596_001714 [Steinernema carpocapsae]
MKSQNFQVQTDTFLRVVLSAKLHFERWPIESLYCSLILISISESARPPAVINKTSPASATHIVELSCSFIVKAHVRGTLQELSFVRTSAICKLTVFRRVNSICIYS